MLTAEIKSCSSPLSASSDRTVADDTNGFSICKEVDYYIRMNKNLMIYTS